MLAEHLRCNVFGRSPPFFGLGDQALSDVVWDDNVQFGHNKSVYPSPTSAMSLLGAPGLIPLAGLRQEDLDAWFADASNPTKATDVLNSAGSPRYSRNSASADGELILPLDLYQQSGVLDDRDERVI